MFNRKRRPQEADPARLFCWGSFFHNFPSLPFIFKAVDPCQLKTLQHAYAQKEKQNVDVMFRSQISTCSSGFHFKIWTTKHSTSFFRKSLKNLGEGFPKRAVTATLILPASLNVEFIITVILQEIDIKMPPYYRCKKTRNRNNKSLDNSFCMPLPISRS